MLSSRRGWRPERGRTDELGNDEAIVVRQVVVEVDSGQKLLEMRSDLTLLKRLERLVENLRLHLKLLQEIPTWS